MGDRLRKDLAPAALSALRAPNAASANAEDARTGTVGRQYLRELRLRDGQMGPRGVNESLLPPPRAGEGRGCCDAQPGASRPICCMLLTISARLRALEAGIHWFRPAAEQSTQTKAEPCSQR